MLILLSIALVLGQCLAQSHPWIAQTRDAYWEAKHEHLLNMTIEHGKDEQLVFVGDSITEGWKANGKEVWRKYYNPRHAYNYGIGGDRTENVLWRIQHKEFDGLKPKVVVLMIGTNNIKGNAVEDVAQGVHEIVKELHLKMPNSKIILLGVLPRPEPVGTKVKQLNVMLKKFTDEKTIYWLDMWSAFESADGHQKTELYMAADLVHLTAAGYDVWQKTMEPLLNKLDPVH